MEITNEDNMKLMSRYKDNYFDLAIVDPPYNIKSWSATGNHSLSQKEIDKLKSWESEPKQEYFNELFRVSKNQIIWGANHFFDFLGKATTFICWDKKNRNCHFADAELGWTSFKNGKVTIFDNYKKTSGNRIHPTQKPVKLYEWLLDKYAKENDKILDTHLGSGSIAIACHNLGYDLTACELDQEYYKSAMKRIKQHKQQVRMF